MFTQQDSQQSDAQYMADLRAALLKFGVTPSRCARLYGLPLTASQVAFAVREYVIGIERNEKAAKHGVQPTSPVAKRKSAKSTSRKSSTVRGG